MARSRRNEEWNHTANLMALMCNLSPRRGKLVHPSVFHPQHARSKREVLTISIRDYNAALAPKP